MLRSLAMRSADGRLISLANTRSRAVGGEAGVRRILELLRAELALDLLLRGLASSGDVDRSLIVPSDALNQF